MNEDDLNDIVLSKIEHELIEEFNNHIKYAHGALMTIFDNEIPDLLLPYPKDLIIKALTNFDRYIFEQTKLENSSHFEFECLDMYVSNDYALKEMAKRVNKAAFRDDFMKFNYFEQRRRYQQLLNKLTEETNQKYDGSRGIKDEDAKSL